MDNDFSEKMRQSITNVTSHKLENFSDAELVEMEKKSIPWIEEEVHKIQQEMLNASKNKPFDEIYMEGKRVKKKHYRVYWTLPYQIVLDNKIFEYRDIEYYDGDHTYATKKGIVCSDYRIFEFFCKTVVEKLNKCDIKIEEREYYTQGIFSKKKKFKTIIDKDYLKNVYNNFNNAAANYNGEYIRPERENFIFMFFA